MAAVSPKDDYAMVVKTAGSEETAIEGKEELEDVDLGSSDRPSKDGAKKKKKKGKKDQKEEGPKVPFSALYTYATCQDYILLVIGAIFGLATGSLMVAMIIIFDVAGGQAGLDMKAMFSKSITVLLIMMAGIVPAAYLQGACFGTVGEHQTDRMRNKFFDNLLRQEIGWFDTSNPLQMTERLAQDTILIQAAISEKFGMFFQFAGMLLTGFTIGFWYQWKIALVICACAPLMAIAGAVMMVLMENITASSQATYAKAGEQAAEALAQSQTIQSFKGENAICEQYERSLAESEKSENKKGCVTGLGFAFFMVVMFSSYAPAFIYGGEIVASDWTRSTAPDAFPNNCGLEFPDMNMDDISIADVPAPQPCNAALRDLAAVNATLKVPCYDPRSNFINMTDMLRTGPPADVPAELRAMWTATPSYLLCMNDEICKGDDGDINLCLYGCRLPKAKTMLNGDASPECTTVGQVLTAFFAIIMGAMALGQATPSITALANGRGAAHKIFEVINRKSKIDPEDESGEAPADGAYEAAIELHDVDFRFPSRPDIQVLHKTSLKIEAGTTVAIVGPSGCGKSTVLQLVQRFYDPEAGRVTLSGQDLSSFNLRWLRQQVGVVEQEPILFDATIGRNIAFGLIGRDATQEEIEAAARSSNAHDFIMEFPQGYDTNVGEGGAQLSGGQKQRIAIARALIKDPKILLLDEATSALDMASEKIVQTALDKLVAEKKRTTIVIAHRLSTIRNADKIVVLNNADGTGARLVEEGNHATLMEDPDGVYRKLVELQLGDQAGDQGGEGDGSDARDAAAGDSAEGKAPELSRKISAELAEGVLSPRAEEHVKRKQAEKAKSFSAATSADQAKKMQSEIDKEELANVKKVPFRRVWSLDSGNGGLYFLGCICAVIQGCVFPVYGIILNRAIAAFFSTDPDRIRKDSVFWGCLFFAVAGTSGGTIVPMFWAFSRAAARLASRVRAKLLRAMLRQDATFFDSPQNNTGKLAWCLAEDATLIKAATGESLMMQFQNISGLLFALIYSFIASWKFTLVAICGTIPLMVSGAIQMQVFMGAQKKTEEAHEKIGHVLNESVNAVRTVTAFNLQPKIYKRYVDLKLHPHKVAIRTANCGGFLNGISQACMYAFIALVFWWMTELLTQPDSTENPVRLLEAMMVLMMGAMGAGQNSALATDQGKAKAALSRVFKVLDAVPAIDPWSPEGKQIADAEFKGRINFNHVKFHYPQRTEAPVFCDLEFEVEPGTTVALVGPSGGGKSTVMQLLERFYDVCGPVPEGSAAAKTTTGAAGSSKKGSKQVIMAEDLEEGKLEDEVDPGSVTIDGVNVKDLNVAWLRETIGMVGQEPILFRDTIANNVRYGKPGCSFAEVQEACKQTNAHDFIMKFPQGYDTPVGGGAGATGLSGGQKQRIAIARALIKDPKILLLDEATSALDTASEKIVQAALDKLLETSRRTTIVIAHRLSTIRNVDKIIVLCPTLDDRGSVVAEQGSHEKLMSIQDGVYRKLVELQSNKQ